MSYYGTGYRDAFGGPSYFVQTVKDESGPSWPRPPSKKMKRSHVEDRPEHEDNNLILCVKTKPCLYNPEDPFYEDGDEKKNSWAAISRKLKLDGMTPMLCRKRWEILCKAYKNKIEGSAEVGDFPISKQLMQSMKFLPYKKKPAAPREKTQKKPAPKTQQEVPKTDQQFLDMVAAALKKYPLRQKMLLQAKIFETIGNFVP